jgi:hypothetical protein
MLDNNFNVSENEAQKQQLSDFRSRPVEKGSRRLTETHVQKDQSEFRSKKFEVGGVLVKIVQ